MMTYKFQILISAYLSMVLSLRSCVIRPMPIKRTYLPISYFTKENTYLTAPYGESARHVLVTSINPLLTTEIKKQYDCDVIEQPILVARALAEEMDIDLVVVTKSYCDKDTCEEMFEVYYVNAPARPLSIVRSRLLESD